METCALRWQLYALLKTKTLIIQLGRHRLRVNRVYRDCALLEGAPRNPFQHQSNQLPLGLIYKVLRPDAFRTLKYLTKQVICILGHTVVTKLFL